LFKNPVAITEGSRVSEFWILGLFCVAVSEKVGIAAEEVEEAVLLEEDASTEVVVPSELSSTEAAEVELAA
jgi:hypothetical protein